MAEIIRTEPALGDADAIANYIALDNPEAAKLLVQEPFGMYNYRQPTRRSVPNPPS